MPPSKSKRIKVAIVHDSIGEFGGAERVLLALSEIWPQAPIYTSFKRKGEFLNRLKGKKIVTSWANNIPFFSTKLHSPLRFLAPWIWGSFDFSKYDVVISSASWYINKGYGQGGPTSQKLRGAIGRPIEFCYCHTPPRWLYGYDTPIGKKNPLVSIYTAVLAHFLRMYDFEKAQKVDYFVANSENVQRRIEKFYRRESTVIYPPIEIPGKSQVTSHQSRDYYLIVSRITGGKGIEMAVKAANKLKFSLKIAGAPSGYSETYEWVKKHAGSTVELLGYVSDEDLPALYSGAKAFLALQRDEDFGMTLPEAMSYGTPVIAFNGGGYPESVVGGAQATVHRPQTGILFDEYSVDGLIRAIGAFGKIKITPEDCVRQAQKFSEDRFKREFKKLVEKHAL